MSFRSVPVRRCDLLRAGYSVSALSEETVAVSGARYALRSFAVSGGGLSADAKVTLLLCAPPSPAHSTLSRR